MVITSNDVVIIDRSPEVCSSDRERYPEDAVRAACWLIEAVCGSILVELKGPLPPKEDIDGLIRAVQGPLGLSPGRSDLPPEIEADIRQTLSGLTSVAKGHGSLPTPGGDAHGSEAGLVRKNAV